MLGKLTLLEAQTVELLTGETVAVSLARFEDETPTAIDLAVWSWLRARRDGSQVAYDDHVASMTYADAVDAGWEAVEAFLADAQDDPTLYGPDGADAPQDAPDDA